MRLYTFLAVLLLANLSFCSLPGDEDYTIATDEMPAPVGGMGSITKYIVYPELAIKIRTQGKVYLLVYVNEHGSVDDVKLVKGIGAGCDEAAINAVKKAKFIPGKVNGVGVKTKITLPIQFKQAG
jgi:protein TonB